LIGRSGGKFERPVRYVLASTTGSYWPAATEDVGAILLLERQNRVCITIKVDAVDSRVDSTATATFQILGLR
jgi:hypothetical protein